MTAAPLTQAEHWVLEATPDESNHDLTLTASATGTQLARLTAEPRGERVEVRPATGEPCTVEAQAIRAHETETVHVTLHDPHHPDAELLATFAAVHGLLVYRTARRQSGYGGDGGGAA
jgi:hypothetical protein